MTDIRGFLQSKFLNFLVFFLEDKALFKKKGEGQRKNKSWNVNQLPESPDIEVRNNDLQSNISYINDCIKKLQGAFLQSNLHHALR